MQAWVPSLPTWGVWSQAACGHLGKDWGVDTTPSQKVDCAEVPVGHLAPMGDLGRQLLLRGPGRISHASKFQEWGVGKHGVWALIGSRTHGPLKLHSWRSLEFWKGPAQATWGTKCRWSPGGGWWLGPGHLCLPFPPR